MPELPEVQTTVSGLQETIIGLTIDDVWSNYSSAYFTGSDTIKDPEYFVHLRKHVRGKKVTSASRRAKNVLINLEGGHTILVHLKMTGHLLYGVYSFNKKLSQDPWQAQSPEALKDPFNKHVHFLISFSNGKHLALSDVRKFAKVTLIESGTHDTSLHLDNIGPEPLEKEFTFEKFTERINLRPNGKIKQVLMDQTIVAGIGNIYADESLWRTGVNPLQKVSTLKDPDLKELFAAIKKTLARGIDFGGDSTSDYRNVYGVKGSFHESHRAYRRTGEPCSKKGCKGKIVRIVLGARGTHYCDVHQRSSNR